MNEEQKIETTKHIQTEGGTIYRLSVSGATLFVLEWTDDGFGNRYWKQLGTASVNTYPYLLAMFNNLAECPDPSAKNEPPFRPGDIVEVVEGHVYSGLVSVIDMLQFSRSDSWRFWIEIELASECEFRAEDLKLVRRGGE